MMLASNSFIGGICMFIVVWWFIGAWMRGVNKAKRK